MSTVHNFKDSYEAMKACRSGAIPEGDVLACEDRVVGVAHAYPFAVTMRAVCLHKIKHGYDVERMIHSLVGHQPEPERRQRLRAGVQLARQVAVQRDWDLDVVFGG